MRAFTRLWLAFACLAMISGRVGAASEGDFPYIQLPSVLSGPAAISALGVRLPEFALSYGKSEKEFAKLLLENPSLWLDKRGRLHYLCDFHAPATEPAGSAAGEVAAGSFPPEQTFLLHSLPEAERVIYLDFDGHATCGTFWNSNYSGGQDIVSLPFDVDGDASSFSSAELDRIQHIWKRVVEDFAPFGVDVTTEDPGVDALRRSGSSDTQYGIRAVISSFGWFAGSGASYVGSFNWSSDTPCFIFSTRLSNGEKSVAEAISHEVGHTLGLHHDGKAGGTECYAGHDNWAPIMGFGCSREITQWSKGAYTGANNTEDDIAVMRSYGVSSWPDDHGGTIPTATALAGTDVFASGVIECDTDVDLFSMSAGDGTIAIQVSPAPCGANLDIQARLLDAAGAVIATGDSQALSTAILATVARGTYYLEVDGVGSGDTATGYSDYASLGQYTVAANIAPPASLHPPVADASANPPSGFASMEIAFSSVASYDPDGSIVGYAWDFGDGTTSDFASPSHAYASPGIFTAILRVTDNDGLSAVDAVTISVAERPNLPPIARASAFPADGSAPLPVLFSSDESQDGDGSIVSYAWSFGDGATSTLANPSHTYAAAGDYIAVLTVTDNIGATATAIVVVTVQPAPFNIVSIGDIAMRVVEVGNWYSGRATVRVVDALGKPVPGAKVTARWTGLTAQNDRGMTDANGTVTLRTHPTKQPGSFTLTVAGVQKSDFTYDAVRNVETTDSISTPALSRTKRSLLIARNLRAW
jgi:PKD repeat protein